MDKFGQRWKALKPQEMKDWSTGEVERVFAALDDWREQFQEHGIKVETTMAALSREGLRVATPDCILNFFLRQK